MELYKKPIVSVKNSLSGLFPVVMAPLFISPIAPIAAVAVGVASALSKKGNSVIDSTHTETLTARKNFAFV